MRMTGITFDEAFANFISHEHIHHLCYQIGGPLLCNALDKICSDWIYNNVNIDLAMRTAKFWHGGLPEHKEIKAIDWMNWR